ncbi:MAG: hypothetical protein VYE22_21350 [Myxococcota bacterium]|nr:hypothetical protein [Myxococcota bacterium]
MRLSILSILLLAVGCAANGAGGDAGHDAGSDEDAFVPLVDSGVRRDSGVVTDDGGVARDAGGDPDSGVDGDAGPGDAGTDSGTGDAGVVDGGTGGGCPGVHPGDTVALDGMGDLAGYPSEQILSPMAPFGPGDQLGLTWDREYLYLTLVSSGFSDPFKPFHVYLEASAGPLGAASPGTGKEYSSLVPALPFTATHLVAVRRQDEAGGIAYDGVYTPAMSWTDRATPLVPGTDVFPSTSAISVRVPLAALGCPTRLRLSAHVVNAVVAEEWKILVPAGAQPWNPMGDPGAHYEIDLTADPAIAGWTTVP